MGFFRFRKSIKLAPGIKINLNKKSVSLTTGVKGFHHTVGTRGSQTTIGLPGTGLSYTHVSPRKSSSASASAGNTTRGSSGSKMTVCPNCGHRMRKQWDNCPKCHYPLTVPTTATAEADDFTAISEKLEPAEVVEFLNEYMTRMVECVNKTNGVVDKFIGDAIMAIWGAPESSGSPAQDALNCVRTALMMRSALREYNKDRGGDKRPIIKIGCGINSGPVIAGQIGSKSRMEYTCIGDAVNFASRTESLNKPLGTDILITEDTYNLIREHVAVEPMPTVTVKGKEKPQRLYAVVNMPQAEDIPGAGKNGPKSLAEVRSLLGIPTPDIEKVDLDADEKKYKIQGN